MHLLLGSFVVQNDQHVKKIIATVQINCRKFTIHRPLLPIYIAHTKRQVFDREMLTKF